MIVPKRAADMTDEIGLSFDGVDLYRLPLERRLLAPLLEWRERQLGDRPYLTVEGRTFTFAEVGKCSRAVARGLALRRIGRGDHLAMMLPNCPEFVFSWFASALRNTAFVPINPEYRGFLFGAPLRESKSRGLIIHRDLFDALASVPADDIANLEWVAVVGGPLASRPRIRGWSCWILKSLVVESDQNPVLPRNSVTFIR